MWFVVSEILSSDLGIFKFVIKMVWFVCSLCSVMGSLWFGCILFVYAVCEALSHLIACESNGYVGGNLVFELFLAGVLSKCLVSLNILVGCWENSGKGEI